jgi:hypothetical protein
MRYALIALSFFISLSACVAEAPAASSTTVGNQTSSPTMNESATPTMLPTATPEPTPGEGEILPPDSVAVVLVDRLRVREAPTSDAKVLLALDPGDQVLVIGNPNWLGPVRADDYDWYPIVYPLDYVPGTETIGWIAAGSGETPFVETVPPTCRGTDLMAVARLTGYGRLACFGDTDLIFEGTYGCGECGGLAPGIFEPAWLAHPFGGHIFQAAVLVGPDGAWSLPGRMAFRMDPAVGIPRPIEGSTIRIAGQFDHPASASCSISAGPPGEEVSADPRAAVLYCREQFVVRSLEVTGVDPNWPS